MSGANHLSFSLPYRSLRMVLNLCPKRIFLIPLPSRELERELCVRVSKKTHSKKKLQIITKLYLRKIQERGEKWILSGWIFSLSSASDPHNHSFWHRNRSFAHHWIAKTTTNGLTGRFSARIRATASRYSLLQSTYLFVRQFPIEYLIKINNRNL